MNLLTPDKIYRATAERRARLAALPFDENVRIMKKLQTMDWMTSLVFSVANLSLATISGGCSPRDETPFRHALVCATPLRRRPGDTSAGAIELRRQGRSAMESRNEVRMRCALGRAGGGSCQLSPTAPPRGRGGA